MKTCPTCGVTKDDSEFYKSSSQTGGLQSYCKICIREYHAKPEVYDAKSLYARGYRAKPENKVARRINNAKPGVREARNLSERKRRAKPAVREAKSLSAREYNAKPEVKAANRKKRKARLRADPQFRLIRNLRSRLNHAVNAAGAVKSAKTTELLGAPWVWVEVHLESLFRPGMTWENHGPVWHIDHIKPCAAFDLRDPDQQRACFHWTNLQPLFALENLQKSDKYADSPEPANCRVD